MSAPIVKICGVREARQARVAVDAGAGMVGLVFAPSRRRVMPEEAVAITGAHYARRPRFVGVFVNEDPLEIARIAGEARLDLAQLSGNEAPEYCAGLHVPYMKVIHMRPGLSVEALLHIAGEYRNAVAIVLDTAGNTSDTAWGGTGMAVDWSLAAQVARRSVKLRPIMLAGGLRAETVAEAVRLVRPWGVDVSSGVETDGVKDDAKIRAFVAAATSAAHDPVPVTATGSGLEPATTAGAGLKSVREGV